MIKIGFVAVSQAHQFLHWIPAAIELGRREGVRVQVLSSSRACLEFVRHYDPDGLLELVHLPTPSFHRDGLFSPPPRWLTLYFHWRRFQQNDLIVTTESTSVFLKRRTPFNKPMVRLRHGAGDRSGGYRPETGLFDGIIVNGEKDRQRIIAFGTMPPERIAVCGYCKFEAISAPYNPFSDDAPIAFYNPHFDPTVSSWYNHHHQVLAAMSAITDWNFIVAPHVKLAKGRSLGSSPSANVLIDPGSVHTIDMSFVEAASVYIGDASSQVYEFIHRPRPCIFLNLDHHDWRGNDHFRHWTFGQVVDDLTELGPALSRAAELQPAFEPIQREALEQSVDPSPIPASARHADTLLHFARYGRFD
jgi:CDP-glycerol glycerophosphotransferase (TagB/SpsB family)